MVISLLYLYICIKSDDIMKSYSFLREMNINEQQSNNSLVDNSIKHLPYTLAYPLCRMFDQIKNKEFGKAMNYALDFIELSSQYISIILLIQLINLEQQKPLEQRLINCIIDKIDKKRPLSLGDWLNEILTPLLILSKKEIKNDSLISTLTTHLLRKQRCILLGDKHEPSVVQIRNEYKGHSTTLSENIYKGVMYTLEPKIITLLKAFEPLWSYNFYSIFNNEKKVSHKGAFSNSTGEVHSADKIAHYYISLNNKVLDLYPFIFVNNSSCVYIFQTLKEEKICYVSSNENALTINDDSHNEAFDSLLQRVAPHFDITKAINWEEYTSIAKLETKRFLANIYREKKYNRELFVNREQISSTLNNFFNSNTVLFPILGIAGQGKTNQLCFWAENLIEQNKCSLIFSSAEFSSCTLDNRLKSIFNHSHRKDIANLIDKFHDIALQNNEYIYIFFDAINECIHYKDEELEIGAVALYNAIIRIFAKKKYSQFKIVITCRSYTWKHSLSRIAQQYKSFTFSPGDIYSSIRGFSPEELKKAYGIYQELYQMESKFDELTPTAKIRLKDPLILKIACTNYLCQTLPEHSKDFTSIALFNKMFNDISSSYAGKKQSLIIEQIAEYILAAHENGIATDCIPESSLKKALEDQSNPLHKLSSLIYKHDGISVAYTELINRPERPILRIAEDINQGERYIQFIYERFLEYVMARVFVARESNNGIIKAPIPPEKYINTIAHTSKSVIYMGAMRNALAIDILRTNDFSTIISMMRDYADNYEVALLISELNNTLVVENYENQIFELINILLNTNIENIQPHIEEFNQITKLINSNKATESIIARHKEVHKALLPIIRLRKTAVITTLNGIFATDYFNEGLYSHDPYQILWRLMNEPISEVKNDAIMYIYYLSVRHHTLSFSPIKQNISEQIIDKMYNKIRNKSLAGNIVFRSKRNNMFSLLETAVRLTVLLIIDTQLSQHENYKQRTTTLMEHIKSIFKYITLDFSIIRLFMPFFQFIMRKQLTFQSNYVNNIIEYQGFWDDSIIPKFSEHEGWSRDTMCKLLPILKFHSSNKSQQQIMVDLYKNMYPAIIEAYNSGDSMSYFVLERITVIMGVADWLNIREIAITIFDNCKQNQWQDYSQMSMLYSLYQIAIYSPLNQDLISIFAREAKDWTLRTKGRFKARNSHKANPMGVYKRNVMNWYAVIYCTHSSDGKPLDGDKRCVPLFYEMIDFAINNNDKLLLFHLIENIIELITDFGFIYTSLNLLFHIIKAYDTSQKVDKLNQVIVERDGIYSQSLVSVIGNTLSTAKNYFADEVDSFIKNDIVGLPFPGIAKYKEQILSYHPSGESLSDLFTHKFGNFLMWSLLHEPVFDDFAIKAMTSTKNAKDCVDWFNKVVKILIKEMFNVNV